MLEHKRITDDVSTVSGFLSESECDNYIAFGESKGFTEAPLGDVVFKDFRNNDRVVFDDVVFAGKLWDRACACVPAGSQAGPGIWPPYDERSSRRRP